MQHTKIKIALITALAAGAVAVNAQTVPNIGNVLNQTQVPAIQQPESKLPNIGGAQIEAPMQALPNNLPKIVVNSFNIVGNREIDVDTLAAQIADLAGKEMSLPELEVVASKLTHFYRVKGYFVARVYVPAQEVVNGQVTLRAVEGNYGQFILKNESLVRDEIVQGLLDDVKKYDIVSLDTLERAMLLINDTPGVQVTRADVMPGQEVGTSDFAVDTAVTKARSGFVMYDNYGSLYTGKNRLSFNADFNSPAGRGDRLSLSGMGTNHAGLLNGRAGYSTLLMPNGLRGEVSVAHTQYSLGNAYSSLDAKGTANVLDATLTYPLRRIRAQTIELSLNAAAKDLEDKINSTSTVTPKKSRAVTAGVNVRDEREVLGFDGLTQANAALTVGDLQFNSDTALSTDAAGAKTAGNFSKAVLSLSRVSLFPASFTLTASFRAQTVLKNKNLDSSERMSVSGSSGVWGLPPGELIGSNATLFKLELARPLPSIKGAEGLQHNLFTFYDYGQASAAVPVSASDYRRSISDVGLGWSGSYQNLIFKAHVAHRIQDTAPTSEPYPRNKFLLQLGYTY
jgi:hemolysin activation/secretion protein